LSTFIFRCSLLKKVAECNVYYGSLASAAINQLLISYAARTCMHGITIILWKYFIYCSEGHENYHRWPLGYKKPSYGPSKVIKLNRVRFALNGYQTTQRKNRTCNSVSILLLSVPSLNWRCVMFCRHPWTLSRSDSDILFIIDSIRLRNLIVARLYDLWLDKFLGWNKSINPWLINLPWCLWDLRPTKEDSRIYYSIYLSPWVPLVPYPNKRETIGYIRLDP
jgi:hypothetical protein